jgi:hypothetical protein
MASVLRLRKILRKHARACTYMPIASCQRTPCFPYQRLSMERFRKTMRNLARLRRLGRHNSVTSSTGVVTGDAGALVRRGLDLCRAKDQRMYRALHTPETCTIAALNNYLHRPRRTRPAHLKGSHWRANMRPPGTSGKLTSRRSARRLICARTVSELPTTRKRPDLSIQARLAVRIPKKPHLPGGPSLTQDL